MEVEGREGFVGGGKDPANPNGNKNLKIVGLAAVVVLVIGAIFWGFSSGMAYSCNAAQKDLGCATCTSTTLCTVCAEGFIEDPIDTEKGEKSCQFPCSFEQQSMGATKCKSASFITECSEGFASTDGICNWQCDENQVKAGCLECTHATKCLKCGEGQALISTGVIDTCAWNCNPEQVKERCSGCDNSDSANPKCTHCQAGYGAKDGKCVTEGLAKGGDDFSKPLGLAPGLNNGFAYAPMYVDEDVAHFFILGDWGGAYENGNWLFGHGAAGKNVAHKSAARQQAYDKPDSIDKHAQTLVASAMTERAKTSKPRFVVNVGDAFYWGGMAAETGCGGDPKKAFGDQRWKDVFEDIYNIPHPVDPTKQIPWMGVLGNHDMGGEHFDSGWDHQIYYTYKDDGMGRWRMPGMWWSQTISWRTFSLDLFFLDGNQMNAKPKGVDPSHNICEMKRRGSVSNGVCKGPGYEELNEGNCAQWFQTNWKTQMAWLTKMLEASKAEWTGLVAHYPNNFDESRIHPLIDSWGVDVLMAGHTHYQAMGQDNPFTCPPARRSATCNPNSNQAPCDCPLRIISGGGGGIASESIPNNGNAQYGFVDMTLTESTMTAKMVNQAGRDGPEIYPTWTIPRRKKRALGEVE